MLQPLGIPEPYDFVRSTFRYRAFGDDLASRWSDCALHRVLASGLGVRIAAAGVEAERALTTEERAEVGHLLGAPFDIDAFARAHPDLAALAPGFRPPLMPAPFEALVTAVTAQQISLLAACSIRNALVARHGTEVRIGALGCWRFPAPERLCGADLEGLGLSAAKMRAIRALAQADLDLAALPDEEVHARLTALPGIGRWTADWFLARCLGRPGAFAAGDLGVRKAVTLRYDPDAARPWPEARVRETVAAFGEHANLAAHYLLAQLASAPA
jgi:DNA-3-methyladenine glycosylase II